MLKRHESRVSNQCGGLAFPFGAEVPEIYPEYDVYVLNLFMSGNQEGGPQVRQAIQVCDKRVSMSKVGNVFLEVRGFQRRAGSCFVVIQTA